MANLNLSEKLLRSMKEIEYKRTLHTPFCEMECIKEIYSILLKLCESTPKEYMSSGSKEKIAPAVEYIAKNYDKSISNDELSKMCGISTVYFRKLFTSQLYSYTPCGKSQRASVLGLRKHHGYCSFAGVSVNI